MDANVVILQNAKFNGRENLGVYNMSTAPRWECVQLKAQPGRYPFTARTPPALQL
jgi:hypothetical protein